MTDTSDLDHSNIPGHVAIIMDGNGRWAQKKGLPRVMGHKSGVESVQEIVESAGGLGIKVLTLYAFSTENWKRPVLEVQSLMGLLKTYLLKELSTMIRNNVRLRSIGQKEKIPPDVLEVLDHTINRTSENSGLILNLALSYGGRNEIANASRRIAEECLAGRLQPEQITEEIFPRYLYTDGLPDPDLLIRTGGEARLSNFLLWQSSYSEVYFTETLWPDFRRPHFIEAILDYQRRQRRFGKTGDQLQNQNPENGWSRVV
jgi:undecaprenyl diphosphate synthase